MGSSPALPTLVSASQLSASPLPNLSPRPRPPCLPSVTPTTSTPPRRLSTSVKAVSKPLVSSLLSSPTLSPTSRLLATTTPLLLPGLILIPDSSAISTASSNLLPKKHSLLVSVKELSVTLTTRTTAPTVLLVSCRRNLSRPLKLLLVVYQRVNVARLFNNT